MAQIRAIVLSRGCILHAVWDIRQRKGTSSRLRLLVGVGVLVGLTARTQARSHASPPNRSEGIGMPSAHQSSTRPTGPQGATAITPHLNLAANAASIASSGTATQPTFTADDASAWVTAHFLPALQQAYGTVTISAVTFAPSEQASHWLELGNNLNLPAGTPVCFVVLDGSFGLIIPWHGAPPATPVTYSHTVLVFNGVNGNLLVRSATSSLPAALAAPATPTAGTTPTTNTTPGTGTSTP